jgi:2,5-dihydroxypyridine 5,6-dioxygenase
MPVSSRELVRAWRHVLDLSRVNDKETVAILTRQGADARNLAAAQHALADIGAQVFLLEPVLDGRTLRENTVVMDALKSVDMVLDFLGLHHLRTYEQADVMKAGVRILYTIEPPEGMVPLIPSQDDKRRVKAAAECLKAAKTMHVESQAGTSLDVRLGEYPLLTQWGYSDEPGHWDHWPSTFLATWPNEGSSNGTVVLMPGDIILPLKNYVTSPVKLTIREGYIVNIEGGFDAEFLSDHIAGYKDKEAYAVSHLGWGLDPRSRWTTLGTMAKHQTNGNEARAFAGNFMFSTGPNTDAGGKRDTRCHLDIPMRNCSVFLDGNPMTLNGKVIPADQAA